jgi:hypothetical protein
MERKYTWLEITSWDVMQIEAYLYSPWRNQHDHKALAQ